MPGAIGVVAVQHGLADCLSKAQIAPAINRNSLSIGLLDTRACQRGKGKTRKQKKIVNVSVADQNSEQ
jgi:hypothetical protein